MSTLAAKTIVPLYAGFWRRAAASLVDSLVLIVPNILVVVLLGEGALGWIAQLAISALYFSLMHASQSQATLGKQLFGIKVTDLQGNRIGYGRALARVPAVWLSFILLLVGVIIAGFTAKKQALHDMICGTLVVNRAASPEEVTAGGDPMPLTGGVWAVMVLLIFLPFVGGILAAIAIPAYHDYTVRAKVAEVLTAVIPLRQEVERAYAEKRPWKVGPAAVESRFTKSVEVTTQGHVVVTVADEIARNGRIRFTPSEAGGALQWRCSAEDVMPKYLPVACRQPAQ